MSSYWSCWRNGILWHSKSAAWLRHDRSNLNSQTGCWLRLMESYCVTPAEGVSSRLSWYSIHHIRISRSLRPTRSTEGVCEHRLAALIAHRTTIIRHWLCWLLDGVCCMSCKSVSNRFTPRPFSVPESSSHAAKSKTRCSVFDAAFCV